MFPVSQRWLNSLSLARWVPSAEWSTDRGKTWSPATLIDGSVTAASTSQVRWSTKLTLADVPTGRGAFNPYGVRIRLFMGLAYDFDTTERIPLGVYRVEDTSTAGLRSGRVEVSAAGLESQLIDARFTTPRKIAPTSAASITERLIREILPEVSLSWRLDDVTIPEMIEEKDRWGLIDGRSQDPSIARSLGGRVFADSRGQFVAAPVASLDDEPVWEAVTGPGGLLVEPQQTLERKGVYNQVVVTGVQDNGQPPIGPVVMSDNDKFSPTFVDGPFGPVPLFYSSKLIETITQCQAAGRGILATKLGLKQKVSAQTVMNPALEPEDVIRIELPDGTLENHVIDSLTIPLTGGGMSMNTRATQARQAGSITLDETDDFGEGQMDG